MSDDAEDKNRIANETIQIIGACLMHQEKEHGQSILVAEEGEAVVVAGLCPGSMVLVCGTAAYAAMRELRTEAQLLDRGVDEAAAAIERLKKGH